MKFYVKIKHRSLTKLNTIISAYRVGVPVRARVPACVYMCARASIHCNRVLEKFLILSLPFMQCHILSFAQRFIHLMTSVQTSATLTYVQVGKYAVT